MNTRLEDRRKVVAEAERMAPYAEAVLPAFGCFMAANDDTAWALAMAYANGTVVGNDWCHCIEQQPEDEFYYARKESGYHGWACVHCLGIRQTG